MNSRSIAVAVIWAAMVIGCSSGDSGADRSALTGLGDVASSASTADSSTTTSVTSEETAITTSGDDVSTTTRATAPTDSTASSTTTITTTTRDLSVLSPDDPARAATNLSSRPHCDQDDPSIALADLSWTPAEHRGSLQVVQVTIDPRGFDHDARTGPELDGSVEGMRWTEISGQAEHFWRVLTEVDGVWLASATSSFEGPTCAVDMAGE